MITCQQQGLSLQPHGGVSPISFGFLSHQLDQQLSCSELSFLGSSRSPHAKVQFKMPSQLATVSAFVEGAPPGEVRPLRFSV